MTIGNNLIWLEKERYRLAWDAENGCIRELISEHSEINWVSNLDTCNFGVPFCNGTQEQETFLKMRPEVTEDGTQVDCVSDCGLWRLQYQLQEDQIVLGANLPIASGPRGGISLDFNFLDMATGTHWKDQVTPVVLYTNEELDYAYFVWHRGDDYLVLVIDGPFCAWRIKYSYHGHRMVGFQVLSQADDVQCQQDIKLTAVDQLRISISFAKSLQESFSSIARLLRIGIAMPSISGGITGVCVPFSCLGETGEIIHCNPVGKKHQLPISKDLSVILDEPGIHKIITRGPSQRRHTTRLIAHDQWQHMFETCNKFYHQHFHDPCGAFYRVISKDTLKPDKLTLEGLPFGDPAYPSSCRTGEFGGFAAWAMIKGMLAFGRQPEIESCVDRYIFNWALNRGHEQDPYPGTICKQPSEYLGIKYSAYHLYREVNYPQHEEFLISQFVDYFHLTGDSLVLEEAIKLAEHFICDHMKPNGMVINQNSANAPEHDYTSVLTPGIDFTNLGNTLKKLQHGKATLILSWAERIADFLVERGLDFPCEGEHCTEDQSMAGTAWTLFYAYLYLKPKSQYLRLGQHIIELHEKLVLRGADCRMEHSSLRFWETLYETAAWGPSINAGHGWTIGTAQAKICLYLITGKTHWLKEAYGSFLCCISNIDSNGGIHPCFTPDMIPGTPPGYGSPHDGCDFEILNDDKDTPPKPTILAMNYPDTYSASGNYTLINAAETWLTISGLIIETNTPINGYLDERTFTSAAPKFNQLALSGVPDEQLKVLLPKSTEFTITFDHPVDELQIIGAHITKQTPTKVHCLPRDSYIIIST